MIISKKTWIKPQLTSFSNQTVNSGAYPDGAENVLTCGGSVIPGSVGFYTASGCVTNVTTAPYVCAGIAVNTSLFSNPVIFATASASAATIAQACS